jgi:hypothetical protein
MPINKLKNIMKNILFPRETATEIQKLAEENNRSFSAQVVYMCNQYLKIKNQ